ncbi:small ribosomal subunit protein uS7 [Candidatus Vidania fulgoroideorum]
MSRKKKIIKNLKKKKINKDPFYNCEIVGKFINIIMKSGKKIKALNIFYKSMIYLRNIYKVNPYKTFIKCFNNSKVIVEIKRRKIGGSFFQIPFKISNSRSNFIAFKNLVNSARISKKKEEFYICLANEIFNSFKGKGNAVKKRDEIHKTAEINRAFSHFLY